VSGPFSIQQKSFKAGRIRPTSGIKDPLVKAVLDDIKQSIEEIGAIDEPLSAFEEAESSRREKKEDAEKVNESVKIVRVPNSLKGQMSVQVESDYVFLVNDQDGLSAYYYYGSNEDGEKGFWEFPAEGILNLLDSVTLPLETIGKNASDEVGWISFEDWLASLDTISTPAYGLGKDSSGNVGWKTATEFTGISGGDGDVA
jgi:hypothetical protein